MIEPIKLDCCHHVCKDCTHEMADQNIETEVIKCPLCKQEAVMLTDSIGKRVDKEYQIKLYS